MIDTNLIYFDGDTQTWGDGSCVNVLLLSDEQINRISDMDADDVPAYLSGLVESDSVTVVF